MSKKTNYEKYTVTLHPLQSEQLKAVALSTDSTYSEIVRAALNMYLSEHGEQK